MKDKIIDLTQKLVQIKSISPNDNGCMDLIASLLKECDFKLEFMPFGDTLNLWATHGSGGKILALAGHTDVVPVGDLDLWTHDPFSGKIDGNLLFGRGSADMKGGLAALVVAACEYVKLNPNHAGKIALLITSDEEANAVNGTVKVIETLMARGVKIDYAIVGEPSSNKVFGDVIKNGRRGSITANLKILGTQGHVAYPHLADNPIHRALPMLAELAAFEWDKGNEFFPPTSLQLVNVKAGTGANNVIPADIYAQFNLRFNTETSVELIKAKVLELLQKYKLNYEIEYVLSGQPFITAPGKLTEALIDAVTTITHVFPKLETTGGTSDGRFIATMGGEVCEFGCLNSTIHKVNECTEIDSLGKLGEIYLHAIIKLLDVSE